LSDVAKLKTEVFLKLRDRLTGKEVLSNYGVSAKVPEDSPGEAWLNA
jgi:hypothetical protein